MAILSDLKYIVTNLTTQEVVDEVEVASFNFTELYNRPGSGQATVRLDSPSCTRDNFASWQRGLWLVSGSQVIWGGFMGQIGPQQGSRVIRVPVYGFMKYFDHRFIRSVQGMAGAQQFGSEVRWLNVDKFIVAKDLIDHAQSFPNGNLGIDVIWDALSGDTISHSYYAYEYKPVGEAFAQLQDNIHGWNWRYTYDYDGNKPHCNIVLLPLGTRRTNFRFEYDHLPGNKNINGVDADGESMPIAGVGAVGAGDGDAMVTAYVADPNMGFPLYEALTSHKDVLNIDTLSGHAYKYLEKYKAILSDITVTVDHNLPPYFTEYVVGDEVEVQIDDGWLDYNNWYRIYQKTIAVTREDDFNVQLGLEATGPTIRGGTTGSSIGGGEEEPPPPDPDVDYAVDHEHAGPRSELMKIVWNDIPPQDWRFGRAAGDDYTAPGETTPWISDIQAYDPGDLVTDAEIPLANLVTTRPVTGFVFTEADGYANRKEVSFVAESEAPTPFTEPFTDTNGDPWDATRWPGGSFNGVDAEIQSNKGRMYSVGGGAAEAIVLEDSGADAQFSVTSISVTLPGGAPTAGWVGLMAIYNSNYQEEPTGLTDGFTLIGQKQTDSVTTVSWYGKASLDGSETTVQANYGTSISAIEAWYGVFSGQDAAALIDEVRGIDEDASSPVTFATLNDTDSDGQAALVAAGHNDTVGTSHNWTNGFTEIYNGSEFGRLRVAMKLITTAGPVTTDEEFSDASRVTNGVIITMRADATGGGVPSASDVGAHLWQDNLLSDLNIYADVEMINNVAQTHYLAFRGDGSLANGAQANCYAIEIHSDGSTRSIKLVKFVAGTKTVLDDMSTTWTTADNIHLHILVAGTLLRARAWLNAASEPGTWSADVTDTTFGASTNRLSLGMKNGGATAGDARWDFLDIDTSGDPPPDLPPGGEGVWLNGVHRVNDPGTPGITWPYDSLDFYESWMGRPLSIARFFAGPLFYGPGATDWTQSHVRAALTRMYAWANERPERLINLVIDPGFSVNVGGSGADLGTQSAVAGGSADGEIANMMDAINDCGGNGKTLLAPYHEWNLLGEFAYVWQVEDTGIAKAMMERVIDEIRSAPNGSDVLIAVAFGQSFGSDVRAALPDDPTTYDIFMPDYYGYDTFRLNEILTDMNQMEAYKAGLGGPGAHIQYVIGEGGLWNPGWGTNTEHVQFWEAMEDRFMSNHDYLSFMLFDIQNATPEEPDHQMSPGTHYPSNVVDAFLAMSRNLTDDHGV
jgi:hypothetical protein